MKRLALLLLAVVLSHQAEAGDEPVLVHFALTGDDKVADQLVLLNAEVLMALEKSARYRLVSQDQLGEHLIMDPSENLEFCSKDPGCIADMGSEVGGRWILFGDAKLSFDGGKILVHVRLVDVPGRKLAREKFGQFENEGDAVQQTGDLVRQLLGIPIEKPKPRPAPVADKPGPLEEPPKTARVLEREAPPALSPWWKNPYTWTAAGVGVASLATATALGVMSRSKVSDAEQLAVIGDPLGAEDRYGKAEGLALGANIAFGLGGAALAAAVVLFVLDITGEPPEATPSVACASDGCAATLTLRF